MGILYVCRLIMIFKYQIIFLSKIEELENTRNLSNFNIFYNCRLIAFSFFRIRIFYHNFSIIFSPSTFFVC